MRILVKYLRCTRDLHLILSYNDLVISQWHVDAYLVVYKDFKLYSGGLMTLSLEGGAMASDSTNQKSNTRSSKVFEGISVDGYYPQILWTLRFMKSQVCMLEMKLFQYNKSDTTLETMGRSSLKKYVCTIIIHYFAIKESIDRKDIECYIDLLMR